MPPAITEVVVNDELLGFHLEDGRFISIPIAFFPTLALATQNERDEFEINGSSVYWPELDVDIGVEGVLAGAREHHFYARKAVERAVRLGRLPKTGKEFKPSKYKTETDIYRATGMTKKAENEKLTISDHEKIAITARTASKSRRKSHPKEARALYYVYYKHNKIIEALRRKGKKAAAKNTRTLENTAVPTE